MTDLYRMTWQKKDDDNAPVITGPILKHQKANPYWAKRTAPYTFGEALATCKYWNRVCATYNHKVIITTVAN